MNEFDKLLFREKKNKIMLEKEKSVKKQQN